MEMHCDCQFATLLYVGVSDWISKNLGGICRFPSLIHYLIYLQYIVFWWLDKPHLIGAIEL